MRWPEKDSPAWKLLTLIVCVGGVLVYMHLAYKNGIDPMKDGGQIAIGLLGYAGVNTVRNMVHKPPTDGEQ